MLLNLSNHPSDKWAQAQLEVARAQYGGVVDMAFPPIDPEADTVAVVALAQDYAQRIGALADVTAVHLMGEMTFLVALVPLLQRAGYEVVCSTTERHVIEEVQGKKTLQFIFTRFRAYPEVCVSGGLSR